MGKGCWCCRLPSSLLSAFWGSGFLFLWVGGMNWFKVYLYKKRYLGLLFLAMMRCGDSEGSGRLCWEEWVENAVWNIPSLAPFLHRLGCLGWGQMDGWELLDCCGSCWPCVLITRQLQGKEGWIGHPHGHCLQRGAQTPGTLKNMNELGFPLGNSSPSVAQGFLQCVIDFFIKTIRLLLTTTL